MSLRAGLFFCLCVACGEGAGSERLHGHVELVLLHTADLHSQLFPRKVRLGSRDAGRGLGAVGQDIEVGGASRIAALFRQERQSQPRTLAFDSGDVMQGAPVFNAFAGEVELGALSLLELDAQVLGNHEFDLAPDELARVYREFARFPVLSANLVADNAQSALAFVEPWTLVSASGLRVGVIGVSNPSSPALLRDRPNPYGVTALASPDVVQSAIDALRPIADFIVALTHVGVDADVALIQSTTGLDVVLGGHQHFVLDEPRRVWDCAGSAIEVSGLGRSCSPRPVVLVHSGAFGKFVGRLALTLSDEPRSPNGFEVERADYELLAVTADAGEDLAMAASLEPYRQAVIARLDPGFVSGYAPAPLPRYGIARGDSPLGNLVADALRRRTEADLSIINTTGLRADLPKGPITTERWFETLPFDDEVVVVTLLGADLRLLFASVAKRAIERETSPIQVSGLRLSFDGRCPTGACAWVADVPLEAERIYTVATTGYLASGPSGYEALGRGVQHGEGIFVRDVVDEFARAAPPCQTSASALNACRAELGQQPCGVLPCVQSDRDGRIELHAN